MTSQTTVTRQQLEDYKQREGKAVETDEIQAAKHALPVIADALHRYSHQPGKGFQAK